MMLPQTAGRADARAVPQRRAGADRVWPSAMTTAFAGLLSSPFFAWFRRRSRVPGVACAHLARARIDHEMIWVC